MAEEENPEPMQEMPDESGLGQDPEAEMEISPEERAMMEQAGIDESELQDLMSEIGTEAPSEPAMPAPTPAASNPLAEMSDTDTTNLGLLLDVNLRITVELGRKDMDLGEVLKLGKGSLIELNKIADEPVDIFVNQSKIAEGEVVVVDDHFGVRITRVLNSERLRRLA